MGHESAELITIRFNSSRAIFRKLEEVFFGGKFKFFKIIEIFFEEFKDEFSKLLYQILVLLSRKK